MAKEILLYSGIYSFVAEELIVAMEENMGSPITMRVNSGGGDVHSTWGIIAKMIEHGDVSIKVDGAAMSSASNLLMYAKSVEALDVSNFVLHRADGYISNPDDQAFLDKVNKDLKAKMTAKIDADKFLAITGYTIEQLFNPETRINVYLSAKQMKEIGVVTKINKVNPSEIKAFNEQMRIAANHQIEKPVNKNSMTLAEFKAQHPAIYAEAVAEGIAKEKDRVEAFMVFAEADIAGVKKGIEDGKEMSSKMMAEFSMKVMAKGKLANVKEDGADPIVTDPAGTPKTDAEKKIAAFEAEVKKNLTAQMPNGGKK